MPALSPPPSPADELTRCWQAVRADIARSRLTFVITWAASSRGAGSGYQGMLFDGLRELARAYQNNSDVRVLVDAKGSACADMPPPLVAWAATGRAHCLQGANRAAREAHTVLRFAYEFYDHLPRDAVVFVQDDPDMQSLLSWHRKSPGPWVEWVGTTAWAAQLQAHHDERSRGVPSPLSHGAPNVAPDSSSQHDASSPWEVQPCPCHVEQEKGLDTRSYGHARTLSWWLRTFTPAAATAANRSRPVLPRQLAWPQHAQFAVAADAIRLRSRAFWRMNLALASPASPRKIKAPRALGECERARIYHGIYTTARRPPPAQCRCSAWKKRGKGWECMQTDRERSAKWANFGPWVLDLSPPPPAPSRIVGKGKTPRARVEAQADGRQAAHGMDLAMMWERLWFVIFDPSVEVKLPPPPLSECLTDEAVAAGVLRCGDDAPPGCSLSDARGSTQAPTDWRFGPGRRRCLSEGCVVPLAGPSALTLTQHPTDAFNATAHGRLNAAIRSDAWSSRLPACSTLL